MNKFTTNINDYLKALKEEIEKLDGVLNCRRYKGQLTNESLQKIKLKLRNHDNCEAFIAVPSMQAEADKVTKRTYLTLLIQVHIVGVTNADKDDIGYSDAVNDVAVEIYNMIVDKGNVLSGMVQVGDPILGALTNDYDAVEEKTRTTLSTITFTQRLRT